MPSMLVTFLLAILAPLAVLIVAFLATFAITYYRERRRAKELPFIAAKCQDDVFGACEFDGINGLNCSRIVPTPHGGQASSHDALRALP